MARDGGKRRRPPADAPAMMSLGTPGRVRPLRQRVPVLEVPLRPAGHRRGSGLRRAESLSAGLRGADLLAYGRRRGGERVLGVALDAVRQADIDVLASDLDDGGDDPVPEQRGPDPGARAQFRALVEAERADDFVVALNLASTTPENSSSTSSPRMSCGLDLSGGVHFLLEVDMDRAVADRLEGFAGEMRAVFREDRLRYVRPIAVDEGRQRISVRFRDVETRDAARSLLLDRIVEFDMVTEDVDASRAWC